MADIIHRVGIRAPASQVYEALATVEGVAGWWSRDTTGAARPGGTVEVRFLAPDGREKGRVELGVIALEPERRVHWRVHAGPPEWVGTDVTFDLSRAGDLTVVAFGHRNWREVVEFTSHCSMKWATFLLSLRDLIETGRGRPAPHDLKIDDWN